MKAFEASAEINWLEHLAKYDIVAFEVNNKLVEHLKMILYADEIRVASDIIFIKVN